MNVRFLPARFRDGGHAGTRHVTGLTQSDSFKKCAAVTAANAAIAAIAAKTAIAAPAVPTAAAPLHVVSYFMPMESLAALLDALWKDYRAINPQAGKIHAL